MDIHNEKTPLKEQDYKDLVRDPISRRLLDNITLAKWVSQADLDREKIIEREIVEPQDEMLFRYCCLIIESVKREHEINVHGKMVKSLLYGLAPHSEFRGVSEQDYDRVVSYADETLEPLRNILERRKSSVQLVYSLRVAHEYFSGKAVDDINQEFPLVIDCLGVLDNYEGDISPEILEENLTELLPLLETDDYQQITEGYIEYINKE